MSDPKVMAYYDRFVENQRSTGINSRLYGLEKRLLQRGLRKNSRVLELGCGIGAMTYLLTKTVHRGFIESVDLSPASIAYAQNKLGDKGVLFRAGNVVEYEPEGSAFDFILLFDVIEHIPLEEHERLFNNLARIAGPHTRIMIHIPHPATIEYDRIHNPQALQVIDQPVYLDILLQHCVKNQLVLHFLETYSLWYKNDYQFLEIRQQAAFSPKSLQQDLKLFEKAYGHLKRAWLRWRDRY